MSIQEGFHKAKKYRTRVSDSKRERKKPVYSMYQGKPLKGDYEPVNSDESLSNLSDMSQDERDRILSGKPPTIPKRHIKVFSDEWERGRGQWGSFIS